MRRYPRKLAEHADLHAWFAQWHATLVSRRRFLLQLAGGSVAALFPWSSFSAAAAADELDDATRWRVLDSVHRHMLPSEPDAPGARELDTIGYLRFIVADQTTDAEERQFVMQGAGWLEDMAKQLTDTSFTRLDESRRERVLRRIEKSDAGQNWLSLLLYYLFEAILADPVYGGNRGGAGWQWLAHIPGFPTPPPDKRYPELMKK